MKFVLTTDSSCDCLNSALKNDNIACLPLSFTIGTETFFDDFDSDAQYTDFYKKIRAGAMPTTSQINPELHAQFFSDILKSGAKAILHVCLSSGLSATYQSACIAADEVRAAFPDCQIFVLDSLGATQAQNYILQRAKTFRNEGLEANEAFEKLCEMRKNLQVWILADDLMHLKRGGRVSAAAAIIGTMLNIKPILIINSEGKLSVVHKAKGIKKAISYFCEKVSALCPDYKSMMFMTASADCHDRADELTRELREMGCKGEIINGWIGPVIGAHTGAGTLGLVFEGKPRIQ